MELLKTPYTGQPPKNRFGRGAEKRHRQALAVTPFVISKGYHLN